MVRVNGKEYEVRSLTMPEVRRVRALDEDAADVLAIHLTTGCPADEVESWFNRVPMGAVQPVLLAIAEASLLTEDAQFPDAAGHDAGPVRETE